MKMAKVSIFSAPLYLYRNIRPLSQYKADILNNTSIFLNIFLYKNLYTKSSKLYIFTDPRLWTILMKSTFQIQFESALTQSNLTKYIALRIYVQKYLS